MVLLIYSIEYLNKNVISILHILFQKIEAKGILLNALNEACIALMPKLDKGITRKEKCGPISLMSINQSVQSLSHVGLFETPWITARQAALFITNSRSSLRLMSIELVMASSHLILCRPLLLLPPIPPSIRVFSNESTLHMRWPK